MIDKIYSKKIIFNDILMTIAPSVKSYLPGPQRGGGWSIYDAELNTQIHSEIFKMLVHVFVKQEICNRNPHKMWGSLRDTHVQENIFRVK